MIRLSWVRLSQKKWGFHRCSVKKCRILGQKCSFLAQNHFFSEMVQILCYYHDWTTNRQHFCVDPVARQASGWLPGPIFCPKFCIFLRYTYETPFFWLGRTQLEGIMSPPYPEVTLDTFGFPVGARLAARRAVLWPRLPKMALFGPENNFFLDIFQYFC